jgi:Ca2+-binding EF-hand superfamily protein
VIVAGFADRSALWISHKNAGSGDGKRRVPRLSCMVAQARGGALMEKPGMKTTSTLLFTTGLLASLGIGVVGPALAERRSGQGAMSSFNFDQLDADKDGKVTEAEIAASRAARVKAADANGDGLMSAEELAAMQLAEMTERATAMAAEMIARMDSDGNGLLSAAEMAARPGPARLFDRIDTDGDGAISRAEADAAAEKMAEGRGDRRPRRGDEKPTN